MHKKSAEILDSQIGKNAKIAIVQAEWYSEYTDTMVAYCEKVLKDHGVDIVELFQVPGSVEIPLACKLLAKSKKFDCLICFGAILKGETYHFEMVANTANEGMNRVVYDFEIPIIQEVLAVYNLEQLKARTADNEFNKGIEAAHAALKSVEIIKKLSE